MKTVELNAKLRSEIGKTALKSVRRQGLVPCVLYGQGDAIHLSIDEKEALKLLHTPDTYLVILNIDGKQYKSIITGKSFHPVFDNLLNIEFMSVREDRPIKVEVPVYLVGNSVGVLAGGKMAQKLRRVKVYGLYNNLPDKLDIDITELKLGRSLTIGDLKYDNFSLAMAKDVPICSVEITRSLRQEAAAAARGK